MGGGMAGEAGLRQIFRVHGTQILGLQNRAVRSMKGIQPLTFKAGHIGKIGKMFDRRKGLQKLRERAAIFKQQRGAGSFRLNIDPGHLSKKCVADQSVDRRENVDSPACSFQPDVQ